jgi:Uma2 family endonuclease
MTAKTETLEELDHAVPSPFFEEEDEDAEEIYYFYDDENNFVKLRQRDMSGSGHELLKQYLMAVLSWLHRAEKCAVYGELNFYETDNPMETPLYPDIAVLKGQEWQYLTSYRLGVTGPAPELVIEIISTKTRSMDLKRKPSRYQKWGTAEYFVYDPRPRRRKKGGLRLWGWRLNQAKTYETLEPLPDGRIWSEQLNCWLVPEKEFLRLYDRGSERLLTEVEATQQRLKRLEEELRRLGGNPDQIS